MVTTTEAVQPEYRILEREIAEWTERDLDQVVACSSGTAALHLAFECMRLSRASEVITSEFNMIACPRAITMAGLHPSLVDCDPLLIIDKGQVDWSLARATNKAILLTHIYGRLCDTDDIYQSIERRNRHVHVVEDMAEVHGCSIHKDTYAACYSFYKNKIVSGEEGGCVIFKDSSDASIARRLRCLGFTDQHDFWHDPRGHNYRLSNVHASLIRKSLKNYKDNVKRRWDIIGQYDDVFPKEWQIGWRDVPWVYDIRIKGLTGTKQGEIVDALNKQGIAARMSFKPISLQSEYTTSFTRGREEALRASKEVFYLPIDLEHTNEYSIQKSHEIIEFHLTGESNG